MENFVILCPANKVTGGPELLHQFVDELRAKNIKAKILYYPFDDSHVIPQAYRKYNIEQITFEKANLEHNKIIFPEVATFLINKFKSNDRYIWWLSVDNYLNQIPHSFKQKCKFFIKKYLLKKGTTLNINEMKGIKHLSQSHYGLLFLNQHGISDVKMLTDYLNDVHLNNNVDLSLKENIVAYNPLKGIEFSKLLINNDKKIKFVPIENMTAEQVGELLNKSKIYIDFGEHPGKDRIPREAAMAKCVVITGRKGSAGNDKDLPINECYKFEESAANLNNINEMILSVFDDFESHLINYDYYCNSINNERNLFIKQVRDFINTKSKK